MAFSFDHTLEQLEAAGRDKAIIPAARIIRRFLVASGQEPPLGEVIDLAKDYLNDPATAATKISQWKPAQ